MQPPVQRQPRPRGPSIEVDWPDATIDAPLRIRLEGFARRAPVTLTATLHAHGQADWQSHACFVSDADGCVDLSTAAPESGSYAGVCPMGLFWSMQPLAGLAAQAPAPAPAQAPAPAAVLQPRHIELRAHAPSGMQAEARIVRRVAAPGVTRHVMRECGLVGTLFLPPGGGRRAAVLVLGGSGGGVPEFVAALLASHGYAALALGYFGMPGLPGALVDIPLEYFEGAIAWMRRQDWLAGGLLAALGFSRGAELALLLGATFPGIGAVVAYVPSGLVHGGVDPDEPTGACLRGAWTYRGQPIAYLQQADPVGDPDAAVRHGQWIVETPLYDVWLRDPDAVRRSAIPVERIAGPVLLISGKDDAMWPSSAMAGLAHDRLVAHRHVHAFAHLDYDGAGHGLFVPYLPTTRSLHACHPVDGKRYALGGSAEGNARAAADSWPRVLDLLEQARRAAFGPA